MEKKRVTLYGGMAYGIPASCGSQQATLKIDNINPTNTES